MGPLPMPSFRLLAGAVALLLAGSLAALPVVDEDGGQQLTVVGPGTPDPLGDDTDDTVASGPPTTEAVSGIPAAPRPAGIRLPRVPKVTLPPVTAPSLPPLTIPRILEKDADAGCRAAVEGATSLGAVLADEGAYVASPDGSGARRLVRSADPGTWDATRRRLAYQVVLDQQRVALCVLEGAAARAIGTTRPFRGFAAPAASQLWVADDRIAALDDGGSTPALHLFDVRAGGRIRDVAGVHPHDVSPDGRSLAFVVGDAPGQELRVADLDTGAVRTVARLDQERYAAHLLRWVPDGSAVAYRTSGLHAVEVATGARRTLVSDDSVGASGAGAYAFAPDGRLAYSTYVGDEGNSRLFVAAADGSGATQVADGPVSWIAWSPQGDRLLLSSARRNDAWLEVIGTDGSNRRTILRAAARPGEHWLRFVLNTGWSPDAARIEFGLWRHPAADSVASPA